MVPLPVLDIAVLGGGTNVLTKHKLYVTTYSPPTEGFSAQPIAAKRSVALARKAVSE